MTTIDVRRPTRRGALTVLPSRSTFATYGTLTTDPSCVPSVISHHHATAIRRHPRSIDPAEASGRSPLAGFRAAVLGVPTYARLAPFFTTISHAVTGGFDRARGRIHLHGADAVPELTKPVQRRLHKVSRVVGDIESACVQVASPDVPSSCLMQLRGQHEMPEPAD